MIYFKDLQDGLYVTESYSVKVPDGSVEITKEEFDQLNYSETKKEDLNAPHLAYLASTDWYVVRFAETGVPVPADILSARQAARDAIV